MRIAARHADPDQTVGAQRLAVAAAVCLGGEGKVDATRAQRLSHDPGVLADQADTHARLALGEAPQDRRHEARDDVVGHAEADLAFEGRRAHRRHQIVVLRHQAVRLGEQTFAGRSQCEPAPLAFEQPARQSLLQPFDLLAGRRLAHMQRRRRARDAAGLDDAQEGAQQIYHKENGTIISKTFDFLMN